MTLATLRAVAAYHLEAATNDETAASLMNGPYSDEFRSSAQRHREWAQQLGALADAFATFGHVLAEPDAKQP